MMKRASTIRLAWLTLAFIALGSAPGRAAAQFDIRDIRPHVMLLVDTSGSMERKPDCLCTTPACLECLPVCSGVTFEQNRWAVVAQALTGEFTPYECSSENRIGGVYSGQYDEGYFLPHVLLPQELPAYTGTQDGNGILDTYLERIKFGLMTFDSVGTLIDQPPLVLQTTFQTAPFPADSAGTKGLYSYGPDAPFTFPIGGPPAVPSPPYMINAGARSASAPEGGLVTVGDDSTGSMNSTNAAIQATLLGDAGLGKNPLRPFGATPTAALVADLQYFAQTDSNFIEKTADPGPGDPFFNCRSRSAILITDGQPNGDMRGDPVNCQDVAGCPYEEIETTVAQMITDGELDKFYVIGFALDGDPAEVAAVETLLDAIAVAGDTVEAQFVADRSELVTALSTILNEQNQGATSRTPPVLTGLTPGLLQAEFISGFNPSFDVSDPWDGTLERRRVICNGLVPEEQPITDADRFQVQLNNQSTAPTDVKPYSSDTLVSFTGGFSRNLWTILPTDVSDVNGHLVGNGKSKITGLTGIDSPSGTGLEVRDVPPGEFNRGIDPAYLFGAGSTDTAQRDTVVEYIHGVPGSGRENERLGDIYHSAPAIVGPLVDDTEDQSYNNWRLGLAHQESPDSTEDLLAGGANDGWNLSRRPRIIYASTNDGVIHAFLTDDYDVNAFSAADGLDEFSCANGKDAGTELWGFIPPMFLDDLDNLLSSGSKQWFADGNIIVRDLYDVRTFSDSAQSATNVWRTVMFVSFRNGANGMVALDVTNPCKPEFLWQFTDSDLGDTYGQPTAAQVFLKDKAPDPIIFAERQAHAVIILPGGQGVEDAAASPCTIASGATLPEGMDEPDGTTPITPRSDRRCWRGSNSSPPAVPTGRALYFIDLATGSLIRKMGGSPPELDTIFPAPLNGGVSVFRGDVGTVGSAVYTADADGILWRIDISSSDPQEWNAEAMHDIYYDGAFDDAEPSYYPPVLTVDERGRVVILTGTGNIDVLDDATAKNRVISVTEELTFDVDGVVSLLEGRLNWEVVLNDGEQMTGPVELFSGQAFFGTFETTGTNPIDSCGIAGSRIFGVSYLDDPANPGTLVPALQDSLMNPANFVDATDVPDLADSIVIGVQVSQQPVCTLTTSLAITDPFGNSFTLQMPTDTSGREFKLIATLSGSGVSASGLAIDVLDETITAPETFTTIAGMGAAP